MKRSFSLQDQVNNGSKPSASNPKLDLNYDIDRVHTEVYALIDDLKAATRDTPKTNLDTRKAAVLAVQPELEAKYQYSFQKCKKLFQLAFDYFSQGLAVSEFRTIFNQFITKIKQLQQDSDPNQTYISTSEQIGKFVGRKFNVPES